MKVLFLTNSLEMGGIETNVVRLTEELSARGHEVLVAARGGVLADHVAAAGGTHVPVRMALGRPGSLLADARVLARLVRERRPDAIHVFSATAGAALALARALSLAGPARRRWPPIVSSIMGLYIRPDEGAARVLLRAWLTVLGSRTTVVMAPTIGQVVRRLRIGPRRVVHDEVVGVRLPGPEATGEARAAATRAELGVAPGAPVVLSIGALDPRKSPELFVAASAHVAARRPDARFFLVGEGGLRAELEEQVERLGLGSRLRLLGERTDVDALLAATDVYVRPGVVEGWVGTTVLEAQAHGVPVVAFETEDVKLSVVDGETGFLAPGRDPEALGRRVLRLIEDRDLARRLGAAGRARMRARSSVAAVADRLLELYGEEAARPAGHSEGGGGRP